MSCPKIGAGAEIAGEPGKPAFRGLPVGPALLVGRAFVVGGYIAAKAGGGHEADTEDDRMQNADLQRPSRPALINEPTFSRCRSNVHGTDPRP